MLAYYLQKGHTLAELLALSPTEKAFYYQSMLVYQELIGGGKDVQSH